MEENVETVIEKRRSIIRRGLFAHRQTCRDILFNQKRIDLSAIHDYDGYISPTKYRNFVEQFKEQKRPTEELMKCLKNHCTTLKHIEEFFNVNGAVDRLVNIFTGNDANSQMLAAAILTNLLCGPHKTTFRLVRQIGAYLVTYICGSSPYLQYQCAWAAGNAVLDCEKCYNHLENSLVPALYDLLQSSSEQLVSSAAAVLRNCSRYTSFCRQTTEQKLTLLMKLMSKSNIELSVISDVANILVEIFSSFPPELMQTHFSGTILTSFKLSVERNDMELSVTLLQCLGHLTQSDAVCQSLVENEDFILSARNILTADSNLLKRVLLWIFTNIAASNAVNHQCIDVSIISQFIQTFISSFQKSEVLQLLYFLCCIEAKSKHRALGDQPLIYALCSSSDPEVSTAAQVFQQIISRKD